MAKKADLSGVPPSLRQTYQRDPIAMQKAVDQLAHHLRSESDCETDWVEALPDADDSLPTDDGRVQAVIFPKRR